MRWLLENCSHMSQQHINGKKAKLHLTIHEDSEGGMEFWASILTLILLALRSVRTLPPIKFLVARFCQRLSGPQGY